MARSFRSSALIVKLGFRAASWVGHCKKPFFLRRGRPRFSLFLKRVLCSAFSFQRFCSARFSQPFWGFSRLARLVAAAWAAVGDFSLRFGVFRASPVSSFGWALNLQAGACPASKAFRVSNRNALKFAEPSAFRFFLDSPWHKVPNPLAMVKICFGQTAFCFSGFIFGVLRLENGFACSPCGACFQTLVWPRTLVKHGLALVKQGLFAAIEAPALFQSPLAKMPAVFPGQSWPSGKTQLFSKSLQFYGCLVCKRVLHGKK